MRGVSTASSPCTCGTEPPVLLGRAPGGFTGRVGEEHRPTGAGDLVFVRRSGRRCPASSGKGLPTPGTTGQRALRDDSARRATTFSTSRRIALLPGRMTNQYLAKARLVFGSVARTRVSVLSKVPAGTGSRRNSIPALIHPGWDQA